MRRALSSLLALVLLLATLAGAQDVRRRPIITGPASTLNTGIVSAWNMEQASGATRVDSVTTNDLADTFGNVAQATGRVNFGAGFGGTIQQLQIADNASLSLTSSMTVAAFVNFTSVAGAGHYPQLVGKWTNGSQQSYLLYYDGDHAQFGFCVSSNGSNQTCVYTTTFGTPTTGTWYLVLGSFDDAGDTIGISVNNGTVDTASFSSSIFDSTSVFQVGRLVSSGDSIDGVIDCVPIWSRALTSGEITEFYNGGNGKQYPY